MSGEIPMPSAMTEEAVAAWLFQTKHRGPLDEYDRLQEFQKWAWRDAARAVLALVEAKVREAVAETLIARTEAGATVDTVVARVMEKEAPRAE